MMKDSNAESIYKTGMMHLSEGRYNTALPFLMEASERGDNRAQREIGMMYIMGLGVDTDYDEGMKWIHKSAENGNHNAQYTLGCSFENDDNYYEAEKWYKKAEFGGSTRASEALTRLREEGKISHPVGVIDFDDARRQMLGKASEWALREIDRMKMHVDHINIAPENNIVDYWKKDKSVISIFYDKDGDPILRRDWPEDGIVHCRIIDNYKQLRLLAPDVVRDWENNGIKIFNYYDGPKGGITGIISRKWMPDSYPSDNDKERAEQDGTGGEARLLRLEPIKEAFEWVVSEQLGMGIVMEAVNDPTNYRKLDHSKIECVISLFIDEEKGRAILRNDYLYIAGYQYYFILNYDEVRRKYPEEFRYLTDNAIKIFRMYDGPNGGRSRELPRAFWESWFTPGVDIAEH